MTKADSLAQGRVHALALSLQAAIQQRLLDVGGMPGLEITAAVLAVYVQTAAQLRKPGVPAGRFVDILTVDFRRCLITAMADRAMDAQAPAGMTAGHA